MKLDIFCYLIDYRPKMPIAHQKVKLTTLELVGREVGRAEKMRLLKREAQYYADRDNDDLTLTSITGDKIGYKSVNHPGQVVYFCC